MSAQVQQAADARSATDASRFVPFTPERIADVMTVERRIYPFPWTSGNFADALRSGYSGWILEGSDASVIAYAVAMLAVDEAHLLNLGVDIPFQRQGYGARMLDWMAQTMREYGAATMLLEVRPTNAAALHLYRNYGFRTIGRRRGYYPGHHGREDAMVMRVRLR